MLIPMEDLTNRLSIHPSGVLHLGGHVGEEADAYDNAGVCRVLWVEAHTEAFAALQRAVSSRPGHITYFGAVSERDDQVVDFYRTSNVCSSSLLPLHKHKEKHPDVSPAGIQKVKTVTVDTLLSRLGLNADGYEFLNMDLQGGEMLALSGMVRYLESCRWVYTEINTEELYLGCALFPEIDSFLVARDFKLVEKKLWSETHAWGDALYVKGL